MSHQLTNEQIARVFAMYLRQQFRHDGSASTIRVVAGITRGFDILDDELQYSPFRIGRSKLLLTPLSAISDEDAIEVGEMTHCWNYKELHGEDGCFEEVKGELLLHGKMFITTCLEKHFAIGANPLLDVKSINAFDFHSTREYLIQQGYAVPLFFAPNHPDNGKTAIELGFAIDKTKEAVC